MSQGRHRRVVEGESVSEGADDGDGEEGKDLTEVLHFPEHRVADYAVVSFQLSHFVRPSIAFYYLFLFSVLGATSGAVRKSRTALR